jgi:hypothetical protein
MNQIEEIKVERNVALRIRESKTGRGFVTRRDGLEISGGRT